MATGYTAPLRDIRFVLEEMIGLDSLASLEGLDSLTPDLVNQVLDEMHQQLQLITFGGAGSCIEYPVDTLQRSLVICVCFD